MTQNGGGIAFDVPFDNNVTGKIISATVTGCRAVAGGAIWSFGATLLLADATVLRDCSAEVSVGNILSLAYERLRWHTPSRV